MPGLSTTCYKKSQWAKVSTQEMYHLLGPPRLSEGTHPATSATEVGLFSTTLPLTVNSTAPFQTLPLHPMFKLCFTHMLYFIKCQHHSPWSCIPMATMLAPQLLLMGFRSIINKLKQFQTFVSTYLLDVITLTETWLTDRIHDNEILR